MNSITIISCHRLPRKKYILNIQHPVQSGFFLDTLPIDAAFIHITMLRVYPEVNVLENGLDTWAGFEPTTPSMRE